MTEGLARLGQDPARRRRVSARMRRRRLRTVLVALLILVLVLVLATHGGGKKPASAVTGVHKRKPPAAHIALTMSSARHLTAVPGSAPSIPWTSTGESAVAVPEAGLLETSGPESAVPIASLTKMMTAYLTLLEHPLSATSPGPDITMTAVDQQGWEQDTVSDASSIEVRAGEVLTERQVLTAMIVRSANNLADTLARWDAGSVTAFVARMNSEAATLGMSETHYVDTNGLDAGSVSTAHDLLILAQTAMRLPSFQSIVDQPSVTVPYNGTLGNYVTAVGSDGIVGIKSGFTDAASSCVVLAAIRRIDGQDVTVYAADLGQPLSLYYAQQEDISMIDTVTAGLRPVDVAGSHEVVGRLSVSGHPAGVPVETSAPLVAVGWPGSTVSVSATEGRIGASVPAGGEVGTLDASAADGTPVSVPVVAVSAMRS